MKIYDYKLTKSLSWCFVLCMSLFVVTNTFAQVPPAEDIVCDDQVNISVGADCTFDIVPGLFTEGLVEGESFYFSGENGSGIWSMGDAVNLPCGTYTVTVTGSGNNCWGTVVVEDKLPPTSTWVDDPILVSCFQTVFDGNLTLMRNSFTDCSPMTFDFGTQYVDNDPCSVNDLILFYVTATDEKGNSWTIYQTYILDRAAAITRLPILPYQGECGDNIDPYYLEEYYNGYVPQWYDPVTGLYFDIDFTYAGQKVYEACDWIVTWEDQDIELCGASCYTEAKKVVRTWTMIDWCTSETFTLVQVLHLKDNTPPEVHNYSWDEQSVDPWLCIIEKYELPDPYGWDACSPYLTWNVFGYDYYTYEPITVEYINGTYYAFNVPKGLAHFYYEATDCCGNVSVIPGHHYLNVFDGVKPVAIAKQFTVISLTNVAGTEDGIAKMYAASLDNGSYDHCTDVKLEIRRDGYFGGTSTDLDYLNPRDKNDRTCWPYSGDTPGPYAQYPCDVVGNDTYRDRGDMCHEDLITLFGGVTPFFDTWDEYGAHARCDSYHYFGDCNADVDPDNGEYVKFCCADISNATVDVNYDGVLDPGYVKVWLRVWDDANMDGIYGNVVHHDFEPNGQGKADLDSDDDDDGHTYAWPDNFNETWGYVKVEVSSPPVLTLDYDSYIPCDWPYQEKYEEGYFISKDFLDKINLEATGICAVDVTVEMIAYPETCPGWYFTLIYTATNKDTKGLTTSKEHHVYVGDPDDYLRCGDIYWPAAFTEVDCTDDLTEPTLDWDADPCDLIGWSVRSDTFIFGPDADACRKIVNEYTVIDWCQFDYYHDYADGGVGSGYNYQENYYGGYFEFEGGNDYFDGELCRDPYYYGYYDYDDSYSYNGVYKYIEIIKVIDHIAPVIEETDETMYPVDADCYTTVRLVNTASDEGCPGGLTWEISVDWDRDGYWDRTYTRDRFNSKLSGGELDFVLWDYGRGNPERYFYGPMYSFDVEYKVFDGCGNVDKEVSTVMVVDKKDPTPYCIHLSSAVMESGSVELWAVDFDQGSWDNCYAYLYFTLNEEHPVLNTDSKVNATFKVDKRGFHYFKGAGEEATEEEYLEGDAQIWWNYGYDPRAGAYTYSSGKIFDCDDLGVTEVRMTVWDGKLNSDFCSVELTLIDNQDACAGARAAVSGNIATEESSDVSLVEVTLENLSNPEYELTVTTGNDGDFAFASNPMYNGYDISAVKDGDDTEGVSTLDLVHIQRHILGITPFDSPYKVIAADINSDRRVSGTDLVVLRKTILGIYKEFPTNNSWRFVERSQSLTVENALSDFNEVINIQDLDANMLNEDFVAVKIGDVNATAKTNARDLGTQTRSAGTVTLELNEQNVRKGDLVDLTFSSKNFNEVYGYQFTLELNGLTLESVSEGSAIMTDANIGVLDNNTLTVSYSDISGLNASDNMFTLTVKATKDGAISNMIALTNTALNSEAYVGTGLDINTVELTVNGDEVNSFRLDQNEPNPFDETTVVGFVLPEAGNATLTVYNVAGKMITSVNNSFAQGYNEVKFTKRDLNTTGVLYYTLKSGDFTATKKMIIIE